MPDIVSSPKLNECGLQKLLLLFESADSNISGYCCVAFLTHCQLGMVIYFRLTLVVLMHCFARPTGGSLDRTFTIEELGAEADIKLLKAIVGNLAHHLYTDQLNIHYKTGVTRSIYPPSVQHTSAQHS